MSWNSGAVTHMIQALRTELRRQGMSVADLAEKIGTSEPTVWRWLRNQGLTVARLNMICAELDLDLADLFELPPAEQAERFTLRQERVLAADRPLSLLFFTILHGAQKQDLIDDFDLKPLYVEQYIERLVRVGLLRVTASGRLRPLTTRTVMWRAEGPLAIAFEQSVRGNVLDLNGAADGHYVSHMLKLSEAGRTRVHKAMQSLYVDILRIADEDTAAGHAASQWSALFMLVRPLPLETMRQWMRYTAPATNDGLSFNQEGDSGG